MESNALDDITNENVMIMVCSRRFSLAGTNKYIHISENDHFRLWVPATVLFFYIYVEISLLEMLKVKDARIPEFLDFWIYLLSSRTKTK